MSAITACEWQESQTPDALACSPIAATSSSVNRIRVDSPLPAMSAPDSSGRRLLRWTMSRRDWEDGGRETRPSTSRIGQLLPDD